jgi:hypothetical protein
MNKRLQACHLRYEVGNLQCRVGATRGLKGLGRKIRPALDRQCVFGRT